VDYTHMKPSQAGGSSAGGSPTAQGSRLERHRKQVEAREKRRLVTLAIIIPIALVVAAATYFRYFMVPREEVVVDSKMEEPVIVPIFKTYDTALLQDPKNGGEEGKGPVWPLSKEIDAVRTTWTVQLFTIRCNPFEDLGMDLYITQQIVTCMRGEATVHHHFTYLAQNSNESRHKLNVSSGHPPTNGTNTSTAVKGTGDWAIFYLAPVLVRDARNASY
jgi:hypothetical protein